MSEKHPELAMLRNEVEIFDTIVDFVQPDKSDVALDIGTGEGIAAFKLAESVKKVYGIEIREERIAKAKETAAKNGIHNTEFSVGIAQNIDFPDEFFNLATCQVALHHFAEPMKALSEINRVLKPGGKFEMSDPVFSEFAQAVWVPVNRLRESDFNCYHTYLQTINMLNESGFEIIKIKPFHFKRGLNKWIADGNEGVRERIKEVVLGLDRRVLEELRFTPDPEEDWVWYYNCVNILSVKKSDSLYRL